MATFTQAFVSQARANQFEAFLGDDHIATTTARRPAGRAFDIDLIEVTYRREGAMEEFRQHLRDQVQS